MREEISLVSFIGKPKEMSPRARWKSLIGCVFPKLGLAAHRQLLTWSRPYLHLPYTSSVIPICRYSPPFDRHDWIVDRPLPPSASVSPDSPTSIRIRYVIDFYTGRLPALLAPDRAAGAAPGREDNFRPNLSFFLDVRPALDGWEGVRMRKERWLNSWMGSKESK